MLECCPVCLGKGYVPAGFYTAIGVDSWSSSTTVPDPCRSCDTKDYIQSDASLSQIRQALQNLVDVARPSFPKTPFREALDTAKALLHASEGRQDLQQDERP